MPRPLFLWFILISCLINPFQLTAQTSDPSQPEVQSFQAITVKKLVEPSTGEFQYNIPLFEIGSYPITLNYNSQINMDIDSLNGWLRF